MARWGRGRPIRLRTLHGSLVGPVAYTTAIETDGAGTFARPFTKASETDAAQAITASKVKAFTSAVETDIAATINRAGAAITYTAATETDVAGGFDKRITLIAATETDAATRLTPSLGRVAELDVAVCITAVRRYVLGSAVETDGTGSITRFMGAVSYTAATEADVAGGFTKRIVVLAATETDAATAILGRKIRAYVATTETDGSITITPQHQRTLGSATETDGLGVFSIQKTRAYVAAVELDVAGSVLWTGAVLGKPVTEPKAILTGTEGQAILTGTEGQAVLTGG